MDALDQHALGNFYLSAQLADAMLMDDAVDSVLNTRTLGLISRPFELVKGPGKQASRAHRDLTTLWDQIFPEHLLTSIQAGWLQLGFTHGRISWRTDDELWMPEIQQWHGSTARFDLASRQYMAQTMEGEAWIRPGGGDWFFIAPYGSYRGWLRGAVRSIAVPWLARQYAIRDWARYNEVHGLPLKLIHVPAGANEEDKQAIVSAVGLLGNETTIALPQGVDGDKGLSYNMELLEAKADTWQAFQGLVKMCNERIAIRLLGQNLTTEVDAGSMAAANVHDRVRLDFTKFDAKAMSAAIREQILKPFCMYNYGDPECAPYPTWDCSPPDDHKGKARFFQDVTKGLANIALSGNSPIDVRAALIELGVPVLAEDAPHSQIAPEADDVLPE